VTSGSGTDRGRGGGGRTRAGRPGALAANDRGDGGEGWRGSEPSLHRPLGRYTRLAALDAADRGDTAGAMALLPLRSRRPATRAWPIRCLFVYGMAAVRARDCATAVPGVRGCDPAQREPAVADRAREGLGLCALVQGQRLLESGKPAEAEDWFRRATGARAPSDVVRAHFSGWET